MQDECIERLKNCNLTSYEKSVINEYLNKFNFDLYDTRFYKCTYLHSPLNEAKCGVRKFIESKTTKFSEKKRLLNIFKKFFNCTGKDFGYRSKYFM